MLRGVKFGLPWKRTWEAASQNKSLKSHYLKLKTVIQHIEDAGAAIEYVDFPSAEEIMPPKGWDW